MKPSRCNIMAEPYCVLTRSNSRILYFLSISRSAILVYPLVHSLKTCFRDSILDVDKRRAGYNTCAQAGSQAENDGGHWWWWWGGVGFNRKHVTADTASDVMPIQQFFQFQEVLFRELKEHQPPPPPNPQRSKCTK